MKSNFYGNRKSLLAVFICAAFLSGSHVAYAVNESLLVSAYQQPSKIKGTVIDANGGGRLWYHEEIRFDRFCRFYIF